MTLDELKRENEILKDALCLEQDRLSFARYHLQNAQDRIKRLEEGGDKAILNSYLPDRLAVWNKAKEAKL